MIDNHAVGKTIAALRQAKGMTQQQLAAVLSVSHQAVSKWENGAALPDIQTLMELTRVFGVTVEQLVSGQIPEARLEKEPERENPIQSLGRFVQDVFDGVGSIFNGNGSEEDDSEEPVTDVFEESDEPCAREDDSADEGAQAEESAEKKQVSVRELLNMAPFMSESALEEMLRDCEEKLTIEEIAKFAPFIRSAYLEELIRGCDSRMSWETLKYVAPFLKKEAVDAFARIAAKGEKIVQPAAKNVNRAAEEVYRNIEHVSAKIGKGVEQAAREVVQMGRNVVSEVGKVFDNGPAETASQAERIAKLRRQAFERAMTDDRWEWIEAHITEIEDEAFRQEIAARAKEKGMQDWVRRNLGDCADPEMIEESIENEDWAWIGDHVQEFAPEMQQRAARAAADADHWEWLAANAGQMDLSECAADIAEAARSAGEKELAAMLARLDIPAAQTERIASVALAEGDYEFYGMVADALSQEALVSDCALLIRTEEQERIESIARHLEPLSVEKLMEEAIHTGNFDAIDLLDRILRTENEEVEA